ncbi:hypothetical protein B0H11DRAFT_2258742 [Mycena galericulata]|nr:hypothetical protein B0H11DRAFT_2258742 [Mycena galericulata]
MFRPILRTFRCSVQVLHSLQIPLPSSYVPLIYFPAINSKTTGSYPTSPPLLLPSYPLHRLGPPTTTPHPLVLSALLLSPDGCESYCSAMAPQLDVAVLTVRTLPVRVPVGACIFDRAGFRSNDSGLYSGGADPPVLRRPNSSPSSLTGEAIFFLPLLYRHQPRSKADASAFSLQCEPIYDIDLFIHSLGSPPRTAAEQGLVFGN